MRADVGHQSHNAVVNPWNCAGISTEISVTEIVRIWWRWCQTNRLKHQKPGERAFY